MAGKVGNPYKYKTLDDLKKAVDAYFAWADANPVRLANVSRMRGKAKSKDPDEQEKRTDTVQRPYTLHELAWKLGVCSWRTFKRDNIDRPGFAAYMEEIENRIAGQQIVGGMAGIYNPALTARLNGLAENINTNEKPPINIKQSEIE